MYIWSQNLVEPEKYTSAHRAENDNDHNRRLVYLSPSLSEVGQAHPTNTVYRRDQMELTILPHALASLPRDFVRPPGETAARVQTVPHAIDRSAV